MVWEYVIKAAAALFMGFLPYLEIYLAVPLAMAAGLDPFSAVFWAGLGNFTAVPLIIFFYQQLCRIPRVEAWLSRIASSRHRSSIDRYGNLFLLFGSPLVGIWIAAALARAAGIKKTPLFVYSALSIIIFGSVVAALTAAGLEYFA